MYCFGKFEENMDLSHVRLAVCTSIYNHLSHWKLNAVDYHSELSNVYFYTSLISDLSLKWQVCSLHCAYEACKSITLVIFSWQLLLQYSMYIDIIDFSACGLGSCTVPYFNYVSMFLSIYTQLSKYPC